MGREEKQAVASMILGIIGLIAWMLPFLGLPVSVIGLVLGLKAFDSAKKNIAIAGIVMCIMGITFSSVNAGLGVLTNQMGQHWLLNSPSAH